MCPVRTKYFLAPQVGFEPTTFRLTAERSTVELLRSKWDSFITTAGLARVNAWPEPRSPAQTRPDARASWRKAANPLL